ncbi:MULTISPECIES: hypothetical protein [Burkholderia]|uniref:hypothetical protein n=1 Tax=Burkholderia TaxID=32008 RepID=UPI0015C6681A|nr:MULTISPECIES: hypothetical protein [Burkholderia]MBY4723965.1 hypothetical protein [Burkholderia contaminans]MCI3973126.1 hypothetical protein [Burkholderia sp. HI4860]MDN7792721.1 hypothetical protein [Burkholderia contaminans]
MSTLKIWGFFILAVAAMLFGSYAYTNYVAQMPQVVWRFSATIWAAWAGWHTFRLFGR